MFQKSNLKMKNQSISRKIQILVANESEAKKNDMAGLEKQVNKVK